ncbi:butyrate kinase [Breoghania sp.]|uniref:butyrate kinase n=1 Tax=Breoghania sp. TaxID=2065378 RepID=UPI00260366F6|nr:butyrate kinase [Breoghania sp.]MDJ0931692.1 butyrate kinase [Breoghania sp.]
MPSGLELRPSSSIRSPVNERSEVARLSGTHQIERAGFCRALNSKVVGRRFAREVSRPYEDLKLVVAHLGGGICISAQVGGRMMDVTDAQEEGSFSAERSGAVPVCQLTSLCFSGQYARVEIERMLVGEGGLKSYLGTADLIEVERRIEAGDEQARLVFDAMAYQIAKEIGGMATVCDGALDAIVLTGGMAHSKRLVEAISKHVAWITRVVVYAGEEELPALAAGALRVLAGEEAHELEPLGAIAA